MASIWNGMSLNDDQDLPAGYRWGEHWSSPGYAGYYVIRESDGASWRVRLSGAQVPILTPDEFGQAFDLNRSGM